MIPKNIKEEHIIKAIEEIKNNGVPKNRKSQKFLLKYKGKYYPPKLVISLANKYANGKVLNPSTFNGGKETNNFLKKLGFEVINSSEQRSMSKSSKSNKEDKSSKFHTGERCPNCKITIKKLLEKIYGNVEENYKFRVGTRPDDFNENQYYNDLKEIFEALQKYRGFKDFVKAKTLPNCDFYVPDPGFILEFDESQHFTLPRKLTLEKYPTNLKLDFNKERWIQLCQRFKSKDNDPPYRDEQRAWYDTLRDFLPKILGLKPTKRLLSRDFVWCSLNPDNPKHVEKFKRLLERRDGPWEIEVKKDQDPFLARIIIADEWEGCPEESKRLLEEIYDRWPKNEKVEFLITCGGFVQFNWPTEVTKEKIGEPKYPNTEIVNILVGEAEKVVKSILTTNLRNKLKQITNYITLGVDSYKTKVSTTQNYIPEYHIELVFLVDLKYNKIYWTGKSYPTPNQENKLVRIVDLSKHFFDLDVGRTMLLGCHDLTVFNPRSKKAKGWRKDINAGFKRIAQMKRPEIVLQHPHTTVKKRTWLNAWSNLKKILPSVKICASAGIYFEPDRNKEEYDKLEDVLESTKCGSSIDFIVT